MLRDPKEFRQRFQRWKDGKEVYDKGRPVTEFKNGKENEIVTNYGIPFIERKAVTLTNAGLATGARLSTNLLDSIADNAERADLPLKTAIGLATKESTLGNPTDDRSFRTLLSPLNRYALRNFGYGQHINTGVLINGNELVNYYASDYVSDHTDSRIHSASGKSLLQKAFEFYKANPAKYNPGQKNYPKLVDKRGEEVMLSPEVQKWLTERKYAKERKINSRKPEYVASWFTKFQNGKDEQNWYDKFVEQHPTISTVASFLPIVGTAMDVYDAYKDPSAKNIGCAALSAATDLVGGKMITKLAGKAILRHRQLKKITKATEKELSNWPYYKNMNPTEAKRLVKALAKQKASRAVGEMDWPDEIASNFLRIVAPVAVYTPDFVANISLHKKDSVGYANGNTNIQQNKLLKTN